jgi:mRNA interferase YafQ
VLKIEYTTQFKRDLKLAKRRKKNIELLQNLMELIVSQKVIPAKHKDHLLTGNWYGHRELHIQPDWLLVYELLLKEKTVIFTRTGTHSDLFD